MFDQIKRPNRASERAPTKLDKAYKLLGDGRWHSTAELARRVGHNFSSILYRMRHHDRNHVIAEPHPKRKRQWRYRLDV